MDNELRACILQAARHLCPHRPQSNETDLHADLRVTKTNSALLSRFKNLVGNRRRCHGSRPARVKRQVGDQLTNFFLSDAIV